MEDFELKSLDELDRAFMAKLSEKSEKSEKTQEKEEYEDIDSGSVIPDLPKDDFDGVGDFDISPAGFESAPAKAPVSAESEKERLKNEYLSQTLRADSAKPFTISKQDSDGLFGKKAIPIADTSISSDSEEEDLEEEKKSSPAITALKAVSIVMLSITVLVFVFGCFLSIFIDNDGISLGSSSLSNALDTYADFGISKGSLIISKTTAQSDLKKGDPIAIAASDNSGSEVYVVQDVGTAYNTQTAITAAPANGGTVINVSSEGGLQVVKYYFPVIGGAIHFAMNNLIIICALFLLLAALWILVLILVEKSAVKRM